ncbi:phosphomannomutase [Aeromonas jandaei]|uniref:phosphomannomutase n=1 Tax=Aeromonas jandaei TaxID=650 RepID=UPI001C05B9CD|nr:phosphomannomutase [Aeromonas jandaei]QWL65361.1 phosphomannomutase [Aeromonas jandaei]
MLNSKNIISSSGVSFGTSGARGLVTDFTPDVCAAFTYSFVEILRGKFYFKKMALAIDNRPSSYAMVQACIAALYEIGVEPIYYGVIPTPALAYHAMLDGIPCIMVTGSHIPFDRNGLKFYRPDGEISKIDESAMLDVEFLFESLETRRLPTLIASPKAAERYCSRYIDFFREKFLTGKRIGVYEHSSAGRDYYASILSSLGAEVVRIERCDSFVPIDTEAVAADDKIKAKKWSEIYSLDAIFSTDGDGDRPLVADENGEWLRGDILGLLCAKALNVQAIAVPISCNTIIANMSCFESVVSTKIGSPYVISELSKLSKIYSRVAGFEANGGFLLGSNIALNGRAITALPTRDAMLPFLIVMYSANQRSISELVYELPQRFTHSDRIVNYPMSSSANILSMGNNNPQALVDCLGFSDVIVTHKNDIDGLRLTFDDGRIVHFRPSGNAPELRCYAEADNVDSAIETVNHCLAAIKRNRFFD